MAPVVVVVDVDDVVVVECRVDLVLVPSIVVIVTADGIGAVVGRLGM